MYAWLDLPVKLNVISVDFFSFFFTQQPFQSRGSIQTAIISLISNILFLLIQIHVSIFFLSVDKYVTLFQYETVIFQ